MTLVAELVISTGCVPCRWGFRGSVDPLHGHTCAFFWEKDRWLSSHAPQAPSFRNFGSTVLKWVSLKSGLLMVGSDQCRVKQRGYAFPSYWSRPRCPGSVHSEDVQWEAPLKVFCAWAAGVVASGTLEISGYQPGCLREQGLREGLRGQWFIGKIRALGDAGQEEETALLLADPFKRLWRAVFVPQPLTLGSTLLWEGCKKGPHLVVAPRREEGGWGASLTCVFLSCQ